MAKKMPPEMSLLLTVICFAIAVASAAGLVLKTDTVGRTIFTAVWALLGFVWLGQFILGKKTGS
ncbi:hypothetical protein ACFL5M_02295 [Candidatus Neomarinimicrobiota bacterium]